MVQYRTPSFVTTLTAPLSKYRTVHMTTLQFCLFIQYKPLCAFVLCPELSKTITVHKVFSMVQYRTVHFTICVFILDKPFVLSAALSALFMLKYVTYCPVQDCSIMSHCPVQDPSCMLHTVQYRTAQLWYKLSSTGLGA